MCYENNIICSHKKLRQKSTLMLMYLCVIGIKKTEKADWSCLADTKQTFNSVDYVGNDRFVFNIKGNDYRLVAMILFAAKKVFIRWIGTHKEYDNKDC